MPNQAQTPPAPALSGPLQPTAPTHYTVQLRPLQRQFVTAGDATLLSAAEREGFALPSSCRNGTCRTCLCKLIRGTVAYTVQWPGLSLEEKCEGYILPCVAKATSDLVIEQAQATEFVER